MVVAPTRSRTYTVFFGRGRWGKGHAHAVGRLIGRHHRVQRPAFRRSLFCSRYRIV